MTWGFEELPQVPLGAKPVPTVAQSLKERSLASATIIHIGLESAGRYFKIETLLHPLT